MRGHSGVVGVTAHTEFCTTTGNLAGVATLVLGGHVIWTLGLAMGRASFLGAQIGARLVKPLIVTISLALAAKLALTRS